jgi:acetoin utilization deacetylase AcuC-like enzyme
MPRRVPLAKGHPARYLWIMPLHIVSHPDYDANFPTDHRFPMGKYSALAGRLTETGILAEARRHVAPPAPEPALKRAHDATYVEQVLTQTVPPRIEREIGFPIVERVARRARLASGGTMLAARLALKGGLACNAAGGSHHARRSHGAGFCTFNDVAVATLDLLEDLPGLRILVVDLDVHQGDGTADILGGLAGVFTLSVHAEKNYPVRKVPSSLDVGLPDGLGDDAYLDRIARLLPQVTDAARPDLVFYNAGVDPHVEDRLGRLALSDTGLRERERLVLGHFVRAGVPLCGVIGGGYSNDVAALAARHAMLFEEAARLA